jgi:hypothetical protein
MKQKSASALHWRFFRIGKNKRALQVTKLQALLSV